MVRVYKRRAMTSDPSSAPIDTLPVETPAPRAAAGSILRSLLPLVGLLIVAVLIRLTGVIDLDEAWIDAHIRGQGLIGQGLYLAVATAAVCFAVPRAAVSFLGGYAFGAASGTGLAWAASVLACAITVIGARRFGRELVSRRFGPRLRRMDGLLSRRPFVSGLLIHLQPAGSALVFNMIGGVSGACPTRFVAGSALAYVPQTVLGALLGAGIQMDAGTALAWLRNMFN